MGVCVCIHIKYYGKKLGPEGEKKYSSRPTLSLTSAIDWGGWLTPLPGRFTPGKEIR